MNSDFFDDFGQILVGIILLALLILAIIIFGLLSPLIAGSVIGVILFLRYLNSDKRKEKEAMQKTLDLYQKACAIAPPDFDEFKETLQLHLNDPLLIEVAIDLYELEGFAPPEKPPLIANSIEGGRYRDRLNKYIASAHDQDAASDFTNNVAAILMGFDTSQGRGIFKAHGPRTPHQMQVLINAFIFEDRYYRDLRQQLNKNFHEQNSIYPEEYKGKNCAWDYLKDTPLLKMEYVTTDVDLVNRDRHTHILGTTGAGKTQLIQYMISKDLDEDCCVIVLDSQRQMIPKLASLGRDMAYISPSNSLALNLFDLPHSGNVQSLLSYIMAGMMNAPLTAKQEVIFQFAIQLLLVIPNANINTFRQLLESTEPFKEHFSKLDPVSREFFEKEFSTKDYDHTKREISWRVWTLLKNPTLARMFSAPTNKFHIKDELHRDLILLDADEHVLQDYTGFFGRLFVAQMLQLAQDRFKGQHRPIYFYIDEAYMYFDKNLTSMLETARKANIGIILAHQNLAQIEDPRIASAIMSLTSTKFASNLSPSDTAAMAKAMHTTPEFINEQKTLQFTLHMRGEGTYGVSVPAGVIEADANHPIPNDEMIERYGYEPEEVIIVPPEPPPLDEEGDMSTHDDDDIVPSDTL